MKTPHAALLICLCLVAAGSGYWFRGLKSSLPLGSGKTVYQAVQEPSAVESFSEVEITKSALDSLAYECIVEAFFRHEVSLRNFSPSGTNALTDRNQHVQQYLAELRECIVEFRGTEPEMRLVQKLLLTMKAEQLYGPWLDLYLDTLYRHPTHDLVGSFAAEAVCISGAVARQEELGVSFQHVLQIPFPFDAKLRVTEAWNQLHHGSQLASSSYPSLMPKFISDD
jgi:hypothetical protein